MDPISAAGLIIRLPKEATDPTFETVAVPPLEETVPGFLALRAAWNWKKKSDDRYQAKREAQRNGTANNSGTSQDHSSGERGERSSEADVE